MLSSGMELVETVLAFSLLSMARAEQRAEVIFQPDSEVLPSTLVTITCRVRNLDASEVILMKFGAGKHRAMLLGSLLAYRYPKPNDSKQLLRNSCLDFSDPDVTFCAAKSQLSVRFKAGPALIGKVSCRPLGSEFVPPVEKELQFTDVFLSMTPQEPTAGQDVRVTCGFDTTGSKSEPEMTGLDAWTKQDRKFRFGSRTLLNKTASRKVTPEDNGRTVTCKMGEGEKSRTLNIRYPPVLTMRPGDGATVTDGTKVTCSAAANPPPKGVTIFFLKSGGGWEQKARGVRRTEYTIPLETESGDLKWACAAWNARGRAGTTRKTRSLRVRKELRFVISETRPAFGGRKAHSKRKTLAIGGWSGADKTSDFAFGGEGLRQRLERAVELYPKLWAAQLEKYSLWKKEHELRMLLLRTQLQTLRILSDDIRASKTSDSKP